MSAEAESSHLRPLSMGELLDEAGAFWKGHLLVLFRVYLGFALVNFALLHAMQLLQRHLAPELLHPEKGRLPGASNSAELAGAYFMFFLLIGLLSCATAWPICRYVGDTRLGRGGSLPEAVRSLLRRLPTLLWAYVLLVGFALGLFLLTSLPGAALVAISVWKTSILTGIAGSALVVLGMVGTMLWVAIRMMMLTPVMALEPVSGWAAFRASGRMLRGSVAPGFLGKQWVRASLMTGVLTLFMLALGLVCQVPTTVLRELYGHSLLSMESYDAVPVWLLVPSELLGVAGQSFAGPLTAIFATLFYLDCKVRREGLDLERSLQSMAATDLPA